MYYAYLKDSKKTLDHLKLFSKVDNYQYWILLLERDPLVKPFRNLPEFKTVLHTIKTKFWDKHKEIKVSLEEKGLL
jgi:hypothetical protein